MQPTTYKQQKHKLKQTNKIKHVNSCIMLEEHRNTRPDLVGYVKAGSARVWRRAFHSLAYIP